jgi:transposase
MAHHRAIIAKTQKTIPVSGSQTSGRPSGSNGHSLCAQDRNCVGGSALGNGVRFRYDLLAALARLAESRCVGQHPPGFTEPITASRPTRLFTCSGRFGFCTSRFWGAKTGPNPTDRRKKGSKHHLVTDANGIPLAVRLTGANRHDVTQLLALIEAIPPIAGKVGRPLRRPASVLGDRAYDSEPHRRHLRRKIIEPFLAERWTDHGSGLGRYRWVVERTLSWLHQNRRLRIRYERRDDIHDAFMTVGCIKICWNYLANCSLC